MVFITVNPIDGLLLADLAAELPMAVRKQRLVETLRWMSFDPLTRASMSPRALTSLKQLQESLNHERNGRAESDRKQAPPEE